MPPRAADALQITRFTRFDGGDYGVTAGFRAPTGTYSGNDVQAFLDGSVGPRCGVTPITTTSPPTGKVAGLGFFNQDAGAGLPWYIVGTAVYTSVTAPGVGLTGALAVTPTLAVQGAPVAAKVYISVYNDKLYELTTTNCTAVGALTPGGKSIVLYGDRLLCANFPGNANRVRFSDANAFTTWGALNYFDVGQGGQITGMWVVRTNVYIAKDDGSWWIYSGVPGSGTDVLRLAYNGLNYPQDWRSGAVIGGSSVWYVAQNENFPSYFNGSQVTAIAEQDTLSKLWSTTAVDVDPFVSAIQLARRGDGLFLAGAGLSGTNRVNLLLRDGKWSRHSIPYILGAAVPGATRVLMCDGGGASASPMFAWWVPTSIERPGLAGTYDAVTDATMSPSVLLPEHVDADGRDLKVVKVYANVRKYNSPGYTNHLECIITSTRLSHDGIDVDSAIRTFDELSSFGTATGVPDRIKFTAVDQGYGTGWKVRFQNIRGIVIDSVDVYYELGGSRE